MIRANGFATAGNGTVGWSVLCHSEQTTEEVESEAIWSETCV